MVRQRPAHQLCSDERRRVIGAIDCCKEEIKAFARLAEKEIPDRKVSVNWKP